MTYEEIWQKIKGMSQRERKQLAYEMTLKGFDVRYIHPHYYFDAIAVHDILFYPPNSQHEIDDKENKYYKALKEIVESDNEMYIRIKRPKWLPRFINDFREGKVVKSFITSRFNCDALNSWYQIMPGKSLAGERSRSLFIWDGDGGEIIYKMVACKNVGNTEYLTFGKSER